MTVPTISNLPTVPATSDPNFETEAPALFNHIKNTFVSEMNSAISFINSSTFDATVEFKNADFTAARNFLYMIDTSSVGISVTLPANPSTGDQLLLMDQKRTFATNNLTIVRNGQNINGAASNVVSKSTGALIRCIFQSSYGWTVDLYEGQWESGTSAGDLVYNGGNVGIGTSAPGSLFDVQGVASSLNAPIAAFINKYDNVTNGTNSYAVMRLARVGSDGVSYGNSVDFGVSRYESSGTNSRTQLDISLAHTTASTDTNVMTLRSDGNVGIGINNPRAKLSLGIGGTAAAPAFILSNDQDTGFYRPAENALGFTTTGVSRMVIDSSGNVGIGTSSPASLLQVVGELNAGINANRVRINSSSSVGIVEFNSTEGVVRSNSGSLEFQTNGSNDRMTIDSSGRVGIGDSSPDSTLDIYAPASTAGFMLSYNDAAPVATTAFQVNAETNDASRNIAQFASLNEGVRMTIRADGNVGIGTSSPDSNLSVCQPGSVAAGRGGQINFHGPVNATDTTAFAYIKGYKQNATNDHTGGFLSLGTRANGQSNPTEKIVVDEVGNMKINSGNLIIGTAGKGIDFSANSHATGMTSELFDSYEEGSFIPTTASDATGVMNAPKGQYTKIGRFVKIQIQFQVTTNFTSNKIGGLPFVIKDSGTLSAIYGSFNVINDTSSSVFGSISDTNTDIVFKNATGNTSSDHNPSTTGNTYRLSFSYETNT